MASANILTLIDALVTEIGNAWTGKTASDSVERVYLAAPNVEELSDLTGRHVYLFPGKYGNNPATRYEDEWTYEVGVLVIERYTSAGAPTKAWMDDRVDFVEGTVMDSVDFDGRTMLAIGARRILTPDIEILTYDLEMLNEKSLFWCELTLTLKEFLAG